MRQILRVARRPGPRFRPEILALEGRQLLSADVLTYHNDNSRTGQTLDETTLTTANVNASTFGRIGSFPTDGKVDAEPLYVAGVTIPGQGVHNVVYIATENDSVYAYDADDGQLLWYDDSQGVGNSMIPPGESAVQAADLIDNVSQYPSGVGILSTPVIDASTGLMYVEVESKSTIDGSPVFHQRLHALNIATGQDAIAPATIDSSIQYPGTGPGGNGTTLSFNPSQYKERDALTLSNGIVYLGWASNYGNIPYTGWVMGFKASDLSLHSVLNINPAGQPTSEASGTSGDSFWNGGGGFAVDAAGSLYNISGNGPFDASLGDYGDSMVRLSTANNALTVADYFTPADEQHLADDDLDFGSGGILLLPPTQNASGQTVQLAVGAGKEGSIYVANTANLGQYSAAANNVDQQLTDVLGGVMAGSPAYYNNQVYFGPINKPLQAYTLNDGMLSTAPTSETSNNFYYPGAASPSISANGNTNGILWAVQKGSQAALYAYDADNLSDELYDSNQAASGRDQFGPDSEFITPMIANGKVYVAAPTGVMVFGLLPTTPAPAPPNPAPTPTPTPTPAMPAPPTILVPAFSSASPLVGGFNQLCAVGADSASGEPSLTYTWSTASLPAGAVNPRFSAAGTNASKLVSVDIETPGTYTFEVTIADPSGQVVTSNVMVVAVYSSPGVAIPVFEGAPAQIGKLNLFAAAGSDPVYGEAGLTYSWTATSLPAGASQPIFNVNGTHASSLVAATFSKPGTYTLRVTIANPAGSLDVSDLTFNVAAASTSKSRTVTSKGSVKKSSRSR